ncbi:MAG TPA: 30S ribosomal protein S6--L-glutamate ligase [Flavobacteriales bacterium]|nr:30S ribosomal protein S6--L-glutamate ligase [Flavobacteriales bacterium]HRE75905.1 30S ribosomal protein S6--L-glutamate ligase [Flavobacteriales bacterium]HRJ35544.1 30S ribosomal protein S6--L-glutamate ligase [Flavobacteriales bacterium]HRJ40018.1 30S ribosomal protein S6--L-glutamate ligase [Flavobacteriales bacterium]
MKIAVLSRNSKLYSTRRLVEAAKMRGHDVVVLDHLSCTMLNEHGKPRMFYRGQEILGIDAVIPRIGSSVTFYGTAVVRQFEMMKVFSVNSSVSITRSRDKLRSLQIFSRHDIGIPKTVFANHPKDIDNLLRLVGGSPVVIKLLEGTQGIGVVLAETEKSAKSIIEAFYGLDASFLVQEFIEEAKGADIRCFVVGGRVVGAMRRQGLEGEFRSNLHRGGKAEVIKITRDERRAALLAAKAMGLNVAGVDMLQSKRGPLILEVNSSPGLEGIEGATGVDIAGRIIEFIESKFHQGYKKDKIVG